VLGSYTSTRHFKKQYELTKKVQSDTLFCMDQTSPPQTPHETTPPVQNNKKKLMIIVIGGGVISSVLIVLGLYLRQTNTELKPTPTPDISPTNVSSKPPIINSFQEILTKNCQKIATGSDSYFYGIQPDLLPVSFDPTAITINPQEQGTISCGFFTPENPNKNFVSIEFNTDWNMNIYDKNSEELGHGGPPFLGSFGQTIQDKKDTKLTIYLSLGEGPTEVKDIGVQVRGERKLPLSNGETILMNVSDEAIPGGDPRLMAILNKYQTTYEGYSVIDSSKIEQIQEEIVKTFFGDVNKLQSPEKEIVLEIQQILKAVNPK